MRLLFMPDRNEHTSINIYSISPIVKSPKGVPIVPVTIIVQSDNMALQLISDEMYPKPPSGLFTPVPIEAFLKMQISSCGNAEEFI